MTPRAARDRDGWGRGQAAVELVLALPVVVALALLVVQTAVLARDYLAVVHAAREGARGAAVEADPGAADRAVRRATALKPSRVATETSYTGLGTDTVTVVVRYRAPTEVPVVGALLPDLEMEHSTTMRVETDSYQEISRSAEEDSGRTRVIGRRILRLTG